MLCDNCKTERTDNDFINNQKFCYQCEYRLKLGKVPKKRTRKPVFCRTCGQEVLHIENLKQRQRTVFCSEECALHGHKELISKYWTKQVPNLGGPYGFNVSY